MRILLLLTTLLIAQVTPPRINGAIEGSVVDSVSMLPVPNVPVTLTTGTVQIDAVSDQSGRFLIPNLSPGAYVVTATLDGYFGPEISSYVFVTESQTSHTTLSMVPAGSISGNVVDDNGAQDHRHSPARALARRFAGARRSRGSLAALVRFIIQPASNGTSIRLRAP